MPTIEERLARMEGAYEHLATKADLAQMELRLLLRLGGLIVAVGAAVVLVDRFLGYYAPIRVPSGYV